MELNEVRGIVTGAARGLGFTFAVELLRAGASIVAGDLSEARLSQLKDAAAPLPGSLTVHELDVANEASVSEFVAFAAKHMDGINLLVNNAGILRDGVVASPEDGWVKKLPTSQWRRVVDVNLTGPFLMTREVLGEVFKRQHSPAIIVNISSVARSGNVGQSSYSASKAGLDALTRTLALELAPFNIRVGGIAPGVIDTPILEGISAEALSRLTAAIPLGRIGKPRDIWLALRFIVECDYFTGRVLEVDGGSVF
jgi:3-oxoacyl-[acyl-carrier protein] reductase